MNDLIELNALIRERERQGRPTKRLERKYFKLLGYSKPAAKHIQTIDTH